MDFDELIENIVNEVMKRIENSRKRALVIFTGGTIGFSKSMEQLNRLKDNGWNLKIFLSRNAESVLNPELICRQLKIDEIFVESKLKDEKALLKDAETLIVPVLTMNSASKIALGISDTAATHIIACAIMKGIPIVAAKDACDPLSNERIDAGFTRIPPAYERKISGYLQEIKEFGIRLVAAGLIFEAVSTGSSGEKKERITGTEQVINKKLITKEDIVLAKSNGSAKICISGTSIVTSLAKDTARELGVGIECI